MIQNFKWFLNNLLVQFQSGTRNFVLYTLKIRSNMKILFKMIEKFENLTRIYTVIFIDFLLILEAKLLLL